MLERVETKMALILLSVLTLLAFLSTVTALILSFVWKYIGFMMSSTDTSYICSAYLTLKLKSNLIYNFNAIFSGGLVSMLFQLAIIGNLAYLLINLLKSKDKYL
jgi:hypothetical protein